jgi:3' exoribonuclease, RNase T-like
MDCMIDLETLGTVPGSAIISIGAVMFEFEFGFAEHLQSSLQAEFYRIIRPDLSRFTVDMDTVVWWMKQNDSARQIFAYGDSTIDYTMEGALQSFDSWYKRYKPNRVWAHGACFDIPLLEFAMRAYRYTPPWSYRDIRDTRTIFDITGQKVDKSMGVEHNALDDAKNQALAVIAAYSTLPDIR